MHPDVWISTLVAERDAALADLGACRDSIKYQDAYTERVDADLSAALAEVERLRGENDRLKERDKAFQKGWNDDRRRSTRPV